jgi:integrase
VTITTVEKRYHYGLDKFLKWAAKEELYRRELPKFICIDENNKTALPRDAFENKELIALISLALFTGCAGVNRTWTPGKYFLQTHIYWGYLVMMLSGMRPGEIGPLACADLVTDGENYFFDLRPFNARHGRVALKDVRDLKTNAAGRVVPVHPLLLELGLLDRMHELEAIGEARLFPEWEKYVRGDGEVRWSQPLTKSWQHVKIILKARADVTLYSLRHLVAEWLDNASVAQRTRDRLLGHASNVPGGYGRKGMYDPAQVAAIHAADPPVIQKMREILLPAKQQADNGQLIVLKPWLTARTD